jgi:hypothetical protein
MTRPFVAVLLTIATAGAVAPLSVRAADVPYSIFVDGRPVDARTPSGISHGGVMFVDVVRAVKTFDGLLTFAGGRTRVTISGTTIDFRIGSSYGFMGTTRVQLPGAPFVAEGQTYVPLATIAKLASARLTIDRRNHRDYLALAPLPAPSPTPPQPESSLNASSDDLVPSPAQALTVSTVARSDAAGLHARAVVANRTARPYVIPFPTAAQIEFVVSRNGTEIWNSLQGPAARPESSPSPAATALPSTLTVPAHGTTALTATWSGYAKAGPGRYTLRVRMLTAIPIDEPPISLDAPQPPP